MIAIDTNLLVYAHRERTPQHKRARLAIERAAAAPRGWGMSAAVLPEFWSVVTHPSSEGRPSTPAQAAAFVRALTDAGALIWLPGPGFGERLLQTASAPRGEWSTDLRSADRHARVRRRGDRALDARCRVHHGARSPPVRPVGPRPSTGLSAVASLHRLGMGAQRRLVVTIWPVSGVGPTISICRALVDGTIRRHLRSCCT